MTPEEVFVDANVFLRYLTWDHPEQAPRAEALLEAAARGDMVLVTTSMAIAEIVWVLESYYELPRGEIERKIVAIVSAPGIVVEEGDRVLQAIVWYVEKSVDFIDAYHAAWMLERGLKVAHTFDRKHFGRFEHVEGVVPQAS